MALALFDLDNTLLNGDSDHSWGIFLAKIGVVDGIEQTQMQDYFYEQYIKETLDMDEFLRFQLRPLVENSASDLHQWRQQYIDEVVSVMIKTGKPELLEPHREAGDDILIVTATNDFITRPIAEKLGVQTLIATQVETINGAYTGRYIGIPSYQNGKVTRLEAWLHEQEKSWHNSYFYSDSINDLPLLEKVDTPIAVTPDDKLRAHAIKLHWKIID